MYTYIVWVVGTGFLDVGIMGFCHKDPAFGMGIELQSKFTWGGMPMMLTRNSLDPWYAP